MSDWDDKRDERKQAYAEKLKDPRWQKKRLEVLNRDEWKCVSCRDETKTLHVHHHYYVRGCDPWEYPLEAFSTLCEDCHDAEGQDIKVASSDLIEVMKRRGFFACDMTEICIGLIGMPPTRKGTRAAIVVRYMLENEDAFNTVLAMLKKRLGEATNDEIFKDPDIETYINERCLQKTPFD